METLHVALLGEPRVVSGDAPVAVRAKKALGLFLWLAQQRAPQSRREAARLFWGGADEEAARTSLRTALQRLPPELAGAIVADRDRLALREPVVLDTERFETLAASDELGALAEAAQVYRGEFWRDGESLDATAEFDDWLQRERTRYRQLAQRVFDRLIARYLERAQHDRARAAIERETAMATARRWLALEPASESAHRWLMQLHADAGQREAALAQYEICRRELAVAHGRSPGAETQRLYEALLGGSPRADPASDATAPETGEAASSLRHAGLPSTGFVGRIDELADIDRLLFEPNCRLLTLQGLGGVGKSRLAHAAVTQQGEQRGRRVAWVALEAARDAGALLLALATALGADLRSATSAFDSAVAALADDEWCVVLDNFEQLVEAPGAVDTILRLLTARPRLKLLVTSRQVLGVQEEWVYELQGLACPDEEARWSAGPQPAAVELFVQRARQSYFGFSLAAEWPHVVRICRAVAGLPLALELSAAWVRSLPCGELAGAIEREMASFESRHRDRPARQQRLDAVVDSSWALLTREQQDALLPLGLFGGSFTPTAAQVVAETSLRVLSSLVDKSLVQRRADGRLALHPIVGDYARRRLEQRANAARDAKRRYAVHFATLLERERARLDGPAAGDALELLRAEDVNLRTALGLWAVDTPPGLARTAEPLASATRALGHYRRLVDDVTAWLEGADLPANVQVELLLLRARTLAELNDVPKARRDFEAALDGARALDQPRLVTRVQGYALVGALVYEDATTGLRALEAIEPALRALHDDPVRFVAPHLRGTYALMLGDYDEAARQFSALIQDVRANGSPQLLGSALDMLARTRLVKGEMDDVDALLAEAIAIHERSGHSMRLARALNTLAHACLQRRPADARRAETLASRALAIFERAGAPLAASSAAHTLGMAQHALGRPGDAREALERAARLGKDHPIGEVEARQQLAILCVETGDLDSARREARVAIEVALGSPHRRLELQAMLAAAIVHRALHGANAFNQAALRRIADDASFIQAERDIARAALDASIPVSAVEDIDAWLRTAQAGLA